MPEILLPNLSGSKHYDPAKTRKYLYDRKDLPFCSLTYSFFKWSDRADFGANQLQNVWGFALFICMKVIPGFPDPLWPAKLKNGHFWVFLEFWPIKKYANVKIGDSQIEGLSTSFNLIPNLLRLDRAPLSYGPGSGE